MFNRLKLIFITTAFIFLGCFSDNKAQEKDPIRFKMLKHQNLQSGWQRINIPEFGTIDIPPTLESQDDSLNASKTENRHLNSSSFIFQQKGLNEAAKGNKEFTYAFETFVRVLTNTTFVGEEYVEKLDSKKQNLIDLIALEQQEKDKILNAKRFTRPGYVAYDTLIKWFPAKYEIVNNMNCIHISYIRQSYQNQVKQPEVLVNNYYFQNYDRIHRLSLSYRINEEEKYGKDLKQVLLSLRIKPIN